MRRRLLADLGLVPTLCLLSVLTAAAQEAPAPTPAPTPSRLVVQVKYLEGAKLAYHSVPGGGWYGRFGRVNPPQPRAAADTVRAVDVKTSLVGGRVEIKVGVHVGERFFDRLDEVAAYTLAPGETATVAELEGVGVAPFVFRVLRVDDAGIAPPVVVNKTQSIEAAVREFTPSPLPRATLALRNLSSKRVRAVELDQVMRDGSRATTQSFEREGKILMEPGGTHERRLGVTDGEATATDFTPGGIESIVVAAVVFEDYTYEGEPFPAARAWASDEGARVQLPRVMALVRGAHAARGVKTAQNLNSFRAAVTALDSSAPQSSLDALAKAYPGLSPAQRGYVRAGLEVAMHNIRRELLDDLDAFEQKFRAAAAENSFKQWLARRQGLYEAWLSRL